MSQQQHANTVQQWAAEESDEAERIEAANQALQEAQDEQFRKEIEEKFPILKGWK